MWGFALASECWSFIGTTFHVIMGFISSKGHPWYNFTVNRENLGEPRSMGVPICHCIVKSHSAEFWVFFALRCYLKIKGPRHLNKRWEIQLIVGRLSLPGQPHGSTRTNRNMCMWGYVSSFSLLFQKWDDLDLIVILSCIYFVAHFS